MEYPLQSIAKIMETAYQKTSGIASKYHEEHGVKGLYEPGDFGEKESRQLAIISTVVWQTIAAALRSEDFKPDNDGETFEAIIKNVLLAHFG